MGEKGMESSAPTRSGVAGAADMAGRMAGVTGTAGAASGATVGGMLPSGGAGLGEVLTKPIQQASGGIGPPPKG